jgi:hypothetical protein
MTSTKPSDRDRLQADLRQMSREVHRYAKEQLKILKARTGRNATLALPHNIFRITTSFAGSYKMPCELLRAYLAHRDTVDTMGVPDRHAYLLPIALRRLGKTDEIAGSHIWYVELKDFKLASCHTLLKQAGYAPTRRDNTLAKMRKLIRAGNPEAAAGGQARSYGASSIAKRTRRLKVSP